MPRTAPLEPLPPTPMGRPPGRTPATRGRSRSHRGGTAEVEDRRIGVTVRWCCRLTQAFTSGATRPTVETINCAKRVLRKTIAARYRPLSSGRLRPDAPPGRRGRGRGRGQDTPRRRIRSQVTLERESCPHAAGHVKRNGTAGAAAHASAGAHTEMCTLCTIHATCRRTTRLGSSVMYINLCNFCTNLIAQAHRVNPSLGGCMRRSVGLGLLMILACPLVVAGQGVPAADSLAKAASAASAANTVAINFVWTLVAGFLV